MYLDLSSCASSSEYDAPSTLPVNDSSPPEFIYGLQPIVIAEGVAVLFDLIIRKYGGETTLNEARVMKQITICYLHGSSPCTIPYLVSKIPVKRSMIFRVVSRLVQRGYIREKINPRDRRKRLIYPTRSFATDVRRHFKLPQAAFPEESRGRFILSRKYVTSNSNIGVKISCRAQKLCPHRKAAH